MWAAYYALLAAVGLSLPFVVSRVPRRRRIAVLAGVGGVLVLATAVMLAHPDRVLVYHHSPLPHSPAASSSAPSVNA